MISMNRLREISDSLNESVIQNAMPENFQVLSYDLRIKNIIVPDAEANSVLEKYSLPPDNTVFVSTIEDIQLPNTLVGLVVQRNSIIRRGLVVDAPVYLPGHHTKLFLRVTNITKDDILLVQDNSIASIMFDELSEAVDGYKGKFSDEFDYRGVGNYSADIPRPIKIDKKIQSIENIEKSLYEKVVTILTIFVGIFSIINLNINFLSKDITYNLMIIYNLMTIGGLGIMISFVGFIINHKRKTPWVISAFSMVLIIITVILCVLLK